MVSDPTGAGATTAEMDEMASRQLENMLRDDAKGEFEIDRELGRGGMAMVYLATEVHLGRKVAIKVLPPDLTFGKGAIERFKREARTAATLDHPNIIPIYRISSGGRLFWYAMKYLEGKSLGDLLDEKKRMSVAETIEILKPVAAALDYAHKRKVVHRDIKPANVMIDAEGRVVLTDFGIAKELAAGSLTSSGSVLGTPFYMSPEQCMGGELTGAADQYSLGVMTYQMLSGQLPFESDSIPSLMHKHCLEPPPPLDVLQPSLPPHVPAAINRALAKPPLERFPSVAAFVGALERPVIDVVTTAAPRRAVPSQDLVATTPVPVARRPRRWPVGVGVLGVIGVASYAIWAGTRPAQVADGAGGQKSDTVAAPLGAKLDSGAKGALSQAPTQQGAADSVRKTPPSAPPAPVMGQVVVTGVVAGLKISIDGVTKRGTRFDLETGRHVLQMTAAGFQSQVDSLVVEAGVSKTVSFAARSLPRPQAAPVQTAPTPAPVPSASVLVIQTTGGWARISVDGAFKGEGTARRDTVPPGTHAVHLERPGYVPVDTFVTIRAGETNIVRIPMKKISP